jgi:hypothetical protein
VHVHARLFTGFLWDFWWAAIPPDRSESGFASGERKSAAGSKADKALFNYDVCPQIGHAQISFGDYFSPMIIELPPGNSRTLVLANPTEDSQPAQSAAV